MTRAELNGYVYLRVRFDFDEPNEDYEYFDVLQGIDDDDVAVWGESLGVKFIPLKIIRNVQVHPRNALPHLFQQARATLTAAGFVFGPEIRGDLIAVRRSTGDIALVWVDTVNTVRIWGDESDPLDVLFDAVVAAL